MIQGVLRLAERPVRAIMTPRQEVYRVDLADPPQAVVEAVRRCPYSRLVVTREGAIDEPVGIVQKKELVDALIAGKPLDLAGAVREPLVLPETTTVLTAIERFRGAPVHAAFVVDEYGVFEGLVTITDLLGAITGELHEAREIVEPRVVPEGTSWLVDGRASLDELFARLNLAEPGGAGYHTAAGLALDALKRIPSAGDSFALDGWRATVLAMDGPTITRLRFDPVVQPAEAED
jgi:putative hemolysin